MKKIIFSIKIVLTSILLMNGNLSLAQKMTIPLMRTIAECPPNQAITFYVKGDNEEIKKELVNYKGQVLHSFKGYLSVKLPTKNVADFVNSSAVEKVLYSYSKPTILSDSMRVKSNIMPLYNGDSPLPVKYRGKGVVIGIIDTGIDITHDDFNDTTGKTKILYIWDQTVTSPTKFPDNFTYGQEWDSTDINNGNCTHVDSPGYYGHGTNVSGIAASTGNATGKYLGSAPEANLIVVASDFNSTNWLNTVADGVEYIFSKADSLGMPCVINISAGSYSGSHDGLDMDAQRIDSIMKAKSGRVIVAAAGNAGSYAPYHLGYDLGTDTNFTWFKFNSSVVIPTYAPSGCVFFELYADTVDFNSNAQFSFGADLTTVNPYQNRGTMQFLNMPDFYNGNYASYIDGNGIFVDSITNNLGQKLADVAIGFYKVNNDKTYVMQVIIDPDSSVIDYAWRFLTTGQGKFDVWSTSGSIIGTSDITDSVPSAIVFPDSLYYKYPDTMQSIVSSFQCLPDVITVGNYVNLNQYVDVQGNTQIPINQPSGELHKSSSIGPTRLGIIKPTVSAPGSTTMSATRMADVPTLLVSFSYVMAQDSVHRTANGTSMASPSVAGVVALLFESCPNYDYSHIKNALIQGAKQDNFTGTVPNNFYGYGKLDALKSILITSSPVIITDNLNNPLGDSLTVCVSDLLQVNQQFLSQKWSTGDSVEIITAASSGLYYMSGIDVSGCLQSSDSVEVVVNPFSIPKPALNYSDTTLCESTTLALSTINPFDSYLWSTGDNIATLQVNQTGGYRVLVTDAEGCKAYSDTINLTFLVAPPKPTISILNDTILNSTIASQYQWYFSDSILVLETNQTLIASDSGYYFVEVFHPNGCFSFSDSVLVVLPVITGTIETLMHNLKVYPNPFHQSFYVEISSNEILELEIKNTLGKTVKKNPIHSNKSPTIFEIRMNGWAPGVYFLYLRGQKNNLIRKIIKE